MELVKDHAAGLVAMLAVRLGGQDRHHAHHDPLVPAVAGADPLAVFDAFAALDDLQLSPGHHLGGPGGGGEHKHRGIVHDAGVIFIGSAHINFRIELSIRKQVVEA